MRTIIIILKYIQRLNIKRVRDFWCDVSLCNLAFSLKRCLSCVTVTWTSTHVFHYLLSVLPQMYSSLSAVEYTESILWFPIASEAQKSLNLFYWSAMLKYKASTYFAWKLLRSRRSTTDWRTAGSRVFAATAQLTFAVQQRHLLTA